MKQNAKEDAKPAPADDAATLCPTPRSVIVTQPFDVEKWEDERGKARVRVRPMSAEQVVQSVGRLVPIIEKMETGATLAEIAAETFDESLAILAVATDQEADYLRRLDAADFVAVFEKVYTENEPFFVRARALMTGKIAQKVRALFRGDGPTSSPISPSTESPTP